MNLTSLSERKRQREAAENRSRMENLLYKMGHFHAADGTPIEKLSVNDLTAEYVNESCRATKIKQAQNGDRL
ncbi:hypothetical protein [Sediminibacillus terrae]|uniref:hypothetical protein n=1 Tax=Sediminibacillus terrae TaxID=1562106 RepID=UPI001296E229|nr:hypothetical protein [Sediminibacillus terrae]